jgi:SAM-dependent methyltransferase
MSKNQYLTMQKQQYDREAAVWSLENKNPVVGSYHQHNEFLDYDTYLFKDFNTKNLVALEYGCGPGRNLIRYADRFSRVDGLDISQINLDKAEVNLTAAGIDIPMLYHNDGESIPIQDNTYDVVFSVICLQHICVHEIRYKIMEEVLRVLKPGGHFCFQMGLGNKKNTSGYYNNDYHIAVTNGQHDVRIDNEDYIKDDLQKIGFVNYKSDIRPPHSSDFFDHWIWIQSQKQ